MNHLGSDFEVSSMLLPHSGNMTPLFDLWTY